MAKHFGPAYAGAGADVTTVLEVTPTTLVSVPPDEARVVRRTKAPLVIRLLSLVLAATTSALLTSCVALAVLQRLGWQSYAIVSGSMEPNIPVGSLVFANTNARYDTGLLGQVIAFRTDGPVMVHRAIEMTDEGIVTKGDANDNADGGVVGPGSYIGAVEFSLPQAGVIFTALGTSEGMAMLALLALASLTMSFAKRHWTRPQTVRVERAK